jgi:signal transduction histidine kinase
MSHELAELNARCARLEWLLHVNTVLQSTLDQDRALQLIVREAVRVTRAASGSIALVNPTHGLLEILAAEGLPPEAGQFRLRLGEGITGWVARAGRPALVNDVRADRRYVALGEAVRSELAVPVAIDGEVRGVLNVDAHQPGAFTLEDQSALEALAAQAAHVIHNTWRYEQLRLQARLFEALVRVGRAINSTLSVDDALQAVTTAAGALLETRLCSLLLLDDTRQWLDLRASDGAGPAYVQKPRLSVEESFVGVVVRRKKPMQVENVQTSSLYQNVEIARREGLVSLLSVPLLFGGEAIGVLNVYTGQTHSFSNEEIHGLAALAELSAIAIEKARLYERIVDAEEQLRQNEQLSALGLLAAEVAHEIRNPLTVMKMLYHSLDLRFAEGDPRARDAALMGQKMDHLDRIVEQILGFARGSEPKLAPVNVNRVLDDLSLLTRHKLQSHGVELVREFAPDLPPVPADAVQLEQAFLNLILNAVQAMPRGGRLTLRTGVVGDSAGKSRPAQVFVEVADTGAGMSEEQQARAFTSLLQSARPGGTGLGLAVVRRVAEVHRGTVSLRSQPGAGATFRVTLPL